MAKDKAQSDETAKEVNEVVIRFRDHNGEETERTYSREVHGDNFQELAKEFCETNATKIVK